MKSAKPFYSQSLRISSALLSGVLLVSGCSGIQKDADGTPATETGAGDSQTGTLYQFDKGHVEGPGEQTPFSTTETPVTVQLSDDLKGAAPPDAEFSVDHYTVSAKVIRERLCRVDIEIEYAPRGKENIKDVREPFGETEQENLVYSLVVNEVLARNVREVGSLPDDDRIAEDATYITTDSSEFAFVKECSETYEDELVVLRFSSTDENRSLETFAVARVAFMKDSAGSSTIRTLIQGDASAYRDSDGSWQQR